MSGASTPQTRYTRQLKLRHFRVIEMLYLTRNMQVAATRLHITPAAVSKSCLEAEAMLGAPLFERSSRGLRPNLLCSRVIESGRRINAELNALDEDIAATHGTLTGHIRIGFQVPALQSALARCVAQLKLLHPYLTLGYEYGMRANLVTGLEAHLYDLLLIDLIDVRSNDTL